MSHIVTGKQGCRKHLEFGGARHFEGTFFLKKKGACSKHEKGTSLFIEKSWEGACPQCPRFLCLWLVLLGVWGWGIFGRSGRDSASRH